MKRLSLTMLAGFSALALLSGCGSSNNGPPPGQNTEMDAASTATPDSSTHDAAPSDGSTADTSTTGADASAGDAAGKDASGTDATAADASSTDASAQDASESDATGPTDSAAPDTGSSDGGAATVGLINPRVVPVTASTPLAVATGAMLPATGATGVPVDTLLRIGFDGPPVLGVTGTVSIHKMADGSVVDTINVADPYAIYDGTAKTITATNETSSKVNVIGGLATGVDQVRVVNYVPILISGNTATIVPHNNKLAYDTPYYVTIDPSLFVGAIGGNAFAGISSNTGWTFTTKAAAPTTLNVAADNTADFATVQGAIDAIAAGSSAPLTINIAPGVYQELLFIRNKKNITLLGTNNGLDAVIQYDNADIFNPTVGAGQTVTGTGATATIPGYNGAATGSLAAGGRAVFLTTGAGGLVLNGITIKNLHGQNALLLPTLPAPTTVTTTVSPTFVNYTSATQAETLYFNISFSMTTAPGTLVAEHSNFVSYQDTLQLKGFSWFYDSFVTGDTDFIWGSPNGALFERSELKSRNNPNGSSVVQSRAYLAIGTTATPASFAASYPGFVFLNSALTKEPGTFTAYLARSPGPATVTGTVSPFFYLTYDIVSYINCSMDTHIAPAGWDIVGGNPPGANVDPSPVVGWREYHSVTPAGAPIDVSQRLANPPPAPTTANPGGSIQLTDANVATFFPDRATIFHGATDGTFTTTGLATFTPAP